MTSEPNARTSFWIDLCKSLSRPSLVAGLLALSLTASAREGDSESRAVNQVAGTWRMVSATLEADGRIERPYGDN
ncbi:hypothetical protein ACXWOE_10090, partial [Streptococcus pyogenes]